MKFSRIARRIDDLARVVIPKEIHRTMRNRYRPVVDNIDPATPIIFDIVNNYAAVDGFQNELEDGYNRTVEKGYSPVLSPEQFKIIGVPLEISELFTNLNTLLDNRTFSQWVAIATKYRKEFGDLRVPRDYICEDGASLGLWIASMRIRYARNALSEHQIQKLNTIDMVWEKPSDEQWNQRYQEAKQYYLTLGNLMVSRDYITETGFALGKWMVYLRAARNGNLATYSISEDRIALLDQIGMVWNVLDEAWHQMYQLAADYYAQNGNLLIPRKNKDQINRLGLWIRAQRYRYKSGKLSIERVQALNSIGMVWNVIDTQWEEVCQSVSRYYKEHGDLNIPANYSDEAGNALRAWLYRQRRLYAAGELSDERVLRLEKAGVTWDVRTARWEAMYQQVKEYVAENGCLPSKRTISKAGENIGIWVCTQKEKAKSGDGISPEQREKLEQIGVSVEMCKQEAAIKNAV